MTWNTDVADAWAALGASGYAVDKGVGDGTGVCQMGVSCAHCVHDELHGLDKSTFEADLHTPAPALCLERKAWGSLNAAAGAVAAAAGGLKKLPEPFVYDLVNTAREVLAQLSTPMLINFTSSFNMSTPSPARINETGALFTDLLADMDRLLETDTAFMLGPWLASARKLGGSATDCIDTQISGDIGACDNFMEWNARAQLTSECTQSPHHNSISSDISERWLAFPAWYPVVGCVSAPVVQQSGRDHDYARKQWSGVIRDVYIPRAEIYWKQALEDAAAGRPFNNTAAAKTYASNEQSPSQLDLHGLV